MFTMRTTKPSVGNKSYIRIASGGWNPCILGKPTDKECNVLANCVGYANGRFNEIITELTGYQGNKYQKLKCNAENFIKVAKEEGLEIGQKPKAGAILCWEGKGDLAGHVAIVEKVYDDNHIYTSESNYGGSAFLNVNRYNTNGRWGIGDKYVFQGFIYNPEVKEESVITPNVERNESLNQVEVIVEKLRVRTEPSLNGTILGFSNIGFYNVYEQKEADGYIWFKIAENQWIASKEGEWTKYYPATDYEKLYKEALQTIEILEEQINILQEENQLLQEKINKAIEDLK